MLGKLCVGMTMGSVYLPNFFPQLLLLLKSFCLKCTEEFSKNGLFTPMKSAISAHIYFTEMWNIHLYVLRAKLYGVHKTGHAATHCKKNVWVTRTFWFSWYVSSRSFLRSTKTVFGKEYISPNIYCLTTFSQSFSNKKCATSIVVNIYLK